MVRAVVSFTRQYDEAEPQRVNRWLAQSGVCSRREAEALITQGRVRIDGVRVDDVGRKIAPGETLSLEDRADDQAPISVVIHKPVGVVSAQPEGRQIPAARLLTRAALWPEGAAGNSIPVDASLAPLGRLDMDSRGLLLLSQDGVLAKALIGPQSSLDKEYVVAVNGALTQDRLARLRHGLRLDGRELKPAKVVQLGAQRLRIVLREGRNRQIRRMCELVDLEVVDLLRVRIGPIRLDDLPEGRWRRLTPAERAALLRPGEGAEAPLKAEPGA